MHECIAMRARKRLTREESKEVTRMRLIEAAERLFVRKGFDDASVEEISETAGYSRGAFYSNFDNKEQVFLAVIDRRAAQSPRRHLPTSIRTRGTDRCGSGVVFESMAAQGLHRPADGIQPKGNARSFCAEAPRGTPPARTRNVRRYSGPVSWRNGRNCRLIGRKSSRLCCWPLHTAWGCLAIDTEPEWEHMYTEAAKLVFDRMTASEISHLG